MKKKTVSAVEATVNHPKSADDSYVVFVSHATYDKWIAEVICDKIESLGVKTWRDDRDINGGDKIPEEIKQAIASCSEVVVLLTPQSVDRPWVLVEIGAAWGQDKRIVPLFYHVEPQKIADVVRDIRGFHLHEMQQFLDDLKVRTERTRHE